MLMTKDYKVNPVNIELIDFGSTGQREVSFKLKLYLIKYVRREMSRIVGSSNCSSVGGH